MYVYVDDLLVTGTANEVVERFCKNMASLESKDLGVVNKFLSLLILLNDERGYVLDQEVTINTILKDHGLEMANGARTLIGEDCNDVG